VTEPISKRKVALFRPYMNEYAIELVSEVLRSGWIGQGPKVDQFEKEIKERLGIRYPVTVNSGTTALCFALHLAGVGPGDEVITTALTAPATNHAILASGATPVFADVQYDTANIDPKDIGHRITKRTKAIIPVDYGGYPCDLYEINKIAKRHNLVVIEDAAHSFGAMYKGERIGNITDYTCFSFQAIKTINTGDGGMISMLSEDKYKAAIRKRWFGIDRNARKSISPERQDFDIDEQGFKYHMNDIAAAIGIGQFRDFDKILARRKEIVEKYNSAFANVPGITLFKYNNDRTNTNWLYTMHVDRREDFFNTLSAKGVAVSSVHFRNDRYSIFGPKRTDLPNLDRLEKDIMSIPIHNFMTDEDVEYVIQCIKEGW
jgi:perosamine synthetase